MPAELTREDAIAWLNGLAAKDRLEPIEIGGLISMALALVDQPTRLAAARAEGYREGVEAAARWHDEQARLFTSAGGRWDGAHTSALLTAAADHRQHAAAIRALTPPPAEPAQPDDGWIEWKGGECPVPKSVPSPVQVRFRDGFERWTDVPRTLCWIDTGEPNDVVAYRIVKPAEPSAPVAEPITPEEVMQVARCVKREAEGAAAARITALEAENAALKARNAELVEGLRPFAKAGELFRPRPPDSFDECVYRPAAGPDYEIGGDHLRRARALLQGGSDAG